MQQTRLGRTDLLVSRICFGTWQFGGDWGQVDRDEALAAIRSARKADINFFDTAQGYGFGQAEQILREGLGDELKKRRDDLVIATKGGLRPDGDDLHRDSSPKWLRQGVEESLGHLGIDHIDIYQVHWPDSDTPFTETAGVLAELVREGKIRHVGVSNFDTAQMAELDRAITVETTQPPYHLFRRDFEREELPWCREHDVGVLVYGPLAHGLLSGRFEPGDTLPEDDWRSGTDLFSGDAFERNLEVVGRLGEMAEAHGHTVAQLAVAWTLAQPGVHAAIVGARRPAHIEGTAAAADVALSESDLEEIDQIMADAVTVGGPSPEM
jgi:aryl-alcohol dehydrogenase-like predicted oxidoreductase